MNPMSGSPIALIAHDLKNALGSLEAQLAALSHAPTAAAAQAAHSQCSDLRRQFIQFLTLYGRDGVMRPHCEDESPTDMLQSVYRLGQSRQQPGVATLGLVISETTDAPPYWYYDPRLVQMALDAALHNACRFAVNQVILSVKQQAGFLVFQIDDDGPGLGAPDASDQSAASTGLGTQLCQAVAQAHRSGERQGRIELFNSPAGGARFQLWLP